MHPAFLRGEQWSNDLRHQGLIMTCLQDQRLGQLCSFKKIHLKQIVFAKGIRDLYRVIAPIASRKFTVSPRMGPRQFFPTKYFPKIYFWIERIRGAYLREGVSF